MTEAPLQAVASAWAVLSAVYGRLPQADFVDALRSPDQLAVWPYDDPASARGTQLLARSGQRAAGGAPEEQLEALVADHRRLFVGPRPLLAAPWESVHRSREGLVFEAETIQVRQAYRRYGLQAPQLNKEPDDHIALEASFVATLAVRALTARSEGDEEGVDELLAAIGDFVRSHLALWVPAFLERVQEHSRTDYHRGMGQLTSGALAQLESLTAAARG